MSHHDFQMRDLTASPLERLIWPALAGFYHGFAQPYGWLALRVVIGATLMIEGWPKITAPLAMTGFVEAMGFYPGWLFSPLLAVVNFIGGAMILLGLWTRPFALANAVMLLVTLYYHIANPYGPVFLTPEGIAFLKDNLNYLTEAGQAQLLQDGGQAFLATVQGKAVTNSLFWAGITALFAAFGGGHFSLDRALGREF